MAPWSHRQLWTVAPATGVPASFRPPGLWGPQNLRATPFQPTPSHATNTTDCPGLRGAPGSAALVHDCARRLHRPCPPPKAHGRDIGTAPCPRGLLCVPLGRDTLSGTRARPPHGGSARQVPERLVCRTRPCHRDKQPRVSVASCDNVTCLPSGLLLVVRQTHRTSARAPRASATRAVPS